MVSFSTIATQTKYSKILKELGDSQAVNALKGDILKRKPLNGHAITGKAISVDIPAVNKLKHELPKLESQPIKDSFVHKLPKLEQPSANKKSFAEKIQAQVNKVYYKYL